LQSKQHVLQDVFDNTTFIIRQEEREDVLAAEVGVEVATVGAVVWMAVGGLV